MAQDNDDINEARRKALRNGEEDPIVVAQRYLNIYRQMHIFPPERKAEFDKMLLELPNSIYTIFGTLPGGMVLQDYVNDLNEKNGGTRKNMDVPPPSASPILEEALSQTVQPQAQAAITQPVQVVQSGNMEVSLGKDFAEQFAGAFDNMMKRQSEMQAESLEKISDSLNKSQLALAACINQNKEEQQKALTAIAKAFEQQTPTNVAQNTASSSFPSDNTLVLQQLIEGQKEINLRLNKMETTSLSGNGIDNQELINALVKSNTEAMQKIASMQNIAPAVATTSDNTEHLLQLIEQSQAQLIEGVAQRILQNNTVMGQVQSSNATNNNANNIQINTPDTSAQTILLVNKIADLQAANEKNMEEAINRLIVAQKEMYESIDHNRSQEIADAIVKGLQSSSLTINNYVPPTNYAPQSEVYEQNQYQNIHDAEPISLQDAESFAVDKIAAPENIAVQNSKPKKKRKKSKLTLNSEAAEERFVDNSEEMYVQTNNSELDNLLNVEIPQDKDVVSSSVEENQSDEDIVFDFDDIPADASEYVPENNALNDEREDNIWSPSKEEDNSEDVLIPEPDYSPVSNIDSESKAQPEIEPQQDKDSSRWDSEKETQPESEKEIDTNFEDSSKTNNDFATNYDADYSSNDYVGTEIKQDLSSSDIKGWGFGAEEVEDDFVVDNTKKIADENDSADQYEEVEMIGSNSYIYIDDLSKQQNVNDNSPIIYNVSQPKLKVFPQIYDDSDEEDVDPYVK